MTLATSSEQRARETLLTAELQTYAHEEFPDNTHNTWSILGIEHLGPDLTIVEAKPDPDDVGYPSFKFMFHFDRQTDAVTCVGNYCCEDGKYSLLGSHPGWRKRLPPRV